MSSKDKSTRVSTLGVKLWQKEESLRSAEVAFITDRQKRPLEYWWETLCSSHMQLAFFKGRSKQHTWLARRESYWEGVRDEVLRQTKYRAVHDRVAELQEVTETRDDVLELLRPKMVDGKKIFHVKPNSLEGMVTAFIKLDQLADAKRDVLLTMIEPELAKDEPDPSKGTQFEPDEFRIVAQMLLEQRRAAQMAQLTTGDSDDDEGSGEAD